MRYLLTSMIALGCTACSTNKPAAVAALPARHAAAEPVIVRMVGRHDVIVVRAGADGATYSVEGKGGDVIVPAMTQNELATKNPAVSRTVHAMQANVQWAGDDE